MPIRLTFSERRIARKLAEIKKKSGSHSPSPAMLCEIAGVAVKHDFCYLSNPHAAELFLNCLKKDMRDEEWLQRVIEHYPSQNRALAEKLEKIAGVPSRNIFVGNGATEIIQAVLQNFVRPSVGVKLPHTRGSLTPTKILVPVPTFSPYLIRSKRSSCDSPPTPERK